MTVHGSGLERNPNGHANGTGKHILPEARKPPNNLDAELGVLGSLLLDNSLIPTVRAIIGPGDFFREGYGIMYRAIGEVFDQGKPVDTVTLAEELEHRGQFKKVGGNEALEEIITRTPHAANARHYAGIVLEKAKARQAIEAAEQLVRDIHSGADDTDSLVGHTGDALAKIRGRRPGPLDLDQVDDELGLTRLSEVKIVPLEWLWPNRIPLGKITLVAGEGGLGKSYMTLDWATIISRGSVWPDAPDTPVQAGDVILLSAEDDLADTVVPRLKAMGANLDRIDALGTAKGKNGVLTPFNLGDIDRLERVIARRPETRMIVIDPITAYLGSRVDDNKNSELRSILGPLADFAARSRVSIVAVTHFSKNSAAKAAARVIGSVAYSNAARATWCVAMDPENDGRRLLMPVKNNLSPDRTSMAYTIEDGVVKWEREPVKVNVNDILSGGPSRASMAKKERLERAVAWITALLTEGSLPSSEVIEKGSEAGFGRDLVWEAKAVAGVRAVKDGKGGWAWRIDGPPSDSF